MNMYTKKIVLTKPNKNKGILKKKNMTFYHILHHVHKSNKITVKKFHENKMIKLGAINCFNRQ